MDGSSGSVRPVLLIVPALVHIENYAVFMDFGMLVLDAILDSGSAGYFFRRLRLMAAYDPAMRVKYDELRFAYLSGILPTVIAGQSGVVVVGTHPTDVDLVEFASVSQLQIEEHGMRELSVRVYGEPVMLNVEYALVSRMVRDSVDEVHTVPVWSDVASWLSQICRPNVVGYAPLLPGKVSKRLLEITAQSTSLRELLKPETVFGDSDGFRSELLVFDYVTAIREEWRDPVVTVLGPTPTIDLAFRLPWFVVEPSVFSRICYRTNQKGVPSMSLRGESLVDLVTNRMAGAFTSGELVGTWVGAMLCDNVVTMQSAMVLHGRVMVPTSETKLTPPLQTNAWELVPYAVLEEYAWAYSACPGVIAVDGKQALSELVDGGVAKEPASIRLAAAFSVWTESNKRIEVAAFIRRLHLMGDAIETFVHDLLTTWERVWQNRDYGSGSAADLVHILPGLTYLGYFAPAFRAAAFQSLGFFPKLSECATYVSSGVSVGGNFLVASLKQAALRLSVISGTTVGRPDVMDLPVGGTKSSWRCGDFSPGYCYLSLFKVEFHPKLFAVLGAYPTYGDVMGMPLEWRIPCYKFRVFVTEIHDFETGLRVLHFGSRGSLRLGKFMRCSAQLTRVTTQAGFVDNIPVGGGMVAFKWFPLAIAAIAVSVMYTLALIAWAIYKCRGQSRGGSGGGGRRGGGYGYR